MAQYYQLPLGGTREQGSHKGYGFSLMSEVLTSLLSGGKPTMLTPDGGRKSSPLRRVQHRVVLRPRRVQGHHGRHAQDAQGDAARSPATTRVMYPGLSEHEEEQERRANGIPLHNEVIEWFSDICAELQLPRAPYAVVCRDGPSPTSACRVHGFGDDRYGLLSR